MRIVDIDEVLKAYDLIESLKTGNYENIQFKKNGEIIEVNQSNLQTWKRESFSILSFIIKGIYKLDK